MLFNTDDILETTRMITQNKLDVRTITMASACVIAVIRISR